MSRAGDAVRRAVGAPLRALLPKNPWLRLLLVAIPVLLVFAFLEPVVSVLGRGLDLLLRTFTPLLDNPVGRLVLLNVLLIGALAIAWYTLRGRYRALRSGLVLRHHLAGVGALLENDSRRSRDLLRKVARSRAEPPSQYPSASEDAKIKLARLALENGDNEEALGWLTRVREKKLGKELQRSLLQLRAEAGLAQGEVLPETLESDLREALQRFPKDRRLLALLRRQLVERGAWEEAAEVQQKVVAAAPARAVAGERSRHVQDLVRAGEAALAAGETKRAAKLARRARSVDDGAAAAGLLGRAFEAEGNYKAAAREWGASGSPEGLAWIAELLDRQPGCLNPRELLECCPSEGCLLLVAREYARGGEAKKALRAARRAARTLGPQPSVTGVLTEVLSLCGQADEAAQLREESVLRLVASEKGEAEAPGAPGPES